CRKARWTPVAERKVTVRLRMLARDYVVGTTEAERMTRQLAAAQRDLSGTSRRMGDDLTRTSRQIELASRRIDESGQRAGRGLLMAAAGGAARGVGFGDGGRGGCGAWCGRWGVERPAGGAARDRRSRGPLAPDLDGCRVGWWGVGG